MDGHWTLSSKQKPGQGPRPLPGYLSHIIMTMLKKVSFDAFDSNVLYSYFRAYPGPNKTSFQPVSQIVTFTLDHNYTIVSQLLSSSEITQELDECRLDLEAGWRQCHKL